FGRQHAGKVVTTAAFREHIERAAGKRLNGFFDYWLEQPGLPALRLGQVNVSPANGENSKRWQVQGEILREGPGPHTVVDVPVEDAHGEVTRSFDLDAGKASFALQTSARPRRVILDKYGLTARANGGA